MRLYEATGEVTVYFMAENDDEVEMLAEDAIREEIGHNGVHDLDWHRMKPGSSYASRWAGGLVYFADGDVTIEQAIAALQPTDADLESAGQLNAFEPTP